MTCHNFTGMTDNDSPPPSCLGWHWQRPNFPAFEPQNDIPTFLFRVTTPRSSSETTTFYAFSQLYMALGPRMDKNWKLHNLVTRPQKEAALSLHEHMAWRYSDEGSRSNLVSWTSSLLWAVIFALRESRMRSFGFGDIQIFAIDTRGIQDRFVDAVELEEFLAPWYADDGTGNWSLDDMLRMEKGNYKSATYLSQGNLALHGRHITTNLFELKKAGLFDMYPELMEWGPGEDMEKKLLRLRDDFQSTVKETTEKDIKRAVAIGRCFGRGRDNEKWTLYVCLSVLVFSERSRSMASEVWEDLLAIFKSVPYDSAFPGDLLICTSDWSPAEIVRADDWYFDVEKLVSLEAEPGDE